MTKKLRFVIKATLFIGTSSLITMSNVNASSDISGMQDNAQGIIYVEVINLESNNGGVMVHLYESSKGFPNTPKETVAQKYVLPQNLAAQASFYALNYGTYAIAVCHDTNSNHDCDVNFLGIPKEGVAVSNNVSGFLGPPSFEDAKVTLDTPVKNVYIHIDY